NPYSKTPLTKAELENRPMTTASKTTFRRGQRVMARSHNGKHEYEGEILALPGETYFVDEEQVVEPGHYRIRYFSRGLGYGATCPANALRPLDPPAAPCVGCGGQA